MSDAPELIHIKRTHPHKDGLDWYVWSDGTKYIRADVSAARIADLERLLAEARDKALDLARAAVQSALVGNPKYDAARLIARDAIRNLKGTP